jgi:hypothetical protein
MLSGRTGSLIFIFPYARLDWPTFAANGLREEYFAAPRHWQWMLTLGNAARIPANRTWPAETGLAGCGGRRPSVNLTGQPASNRDASWKLWVRAAACLQVWPASIQVESLLQHIKCVAHYLLRVLPELPIEPGIVVCVHATLERFGVGGPIKEPRRYAQRTNPIASLPCSADLIALAIHCRQPVAGRTLNCALAKPGAKFEG